MHYKYAVIYTDGGEHQNMAGAGIHGYLFNDLHTVRYSKVPAIITPSGYEPKPSGAQLKDESYNPTYKEWDVSVSLRDTKTAVASGADIKIIDGWLPLPGCTSQYAELAAFLWLFEQTEFTFEHLIVHTDSNYLVKGIYEHLKQWIKRGWKKRDGMPIANPEQWAKINEIVNSPDFSESRVEKIAAHKGHYGNECADRNATMARYMAANRYNGCKIIISDVHDFDYWEPVKDFPPLASQKWLVSFNERIRDKSEIDGEVYNHYFFADHTKENSRPDLLAKFISDANYCLYLCKDRISFVDDIIDKHKEMLWRDTCEMYQSELVNLVNMTNLQMPKNLWEIKRGPSGAMGLSEDRCELKGAKAENVISHVINPPKLSYRVEEYELQHREIIQSYLSKSGRRFTGDDNFRPFNIVVNDITDILYDDAVDKKGNVSGKVLSDVYGQVTRMLDFHVHHPYSDKTAKVILTSKEDLPERSLLTKIKDMNPKVSIITWIHTGYKINYGTLVEYDDGIALWTAYGSTRVLTKEEQDIA